MCDPYIGCSSYHLCGRQRNCDEVDASKVRMHATAVQDVKEKCKRDFLSAYAAELVFWPAFQAVNFWKVPVRHQLLAVNTACLLDATFLCW